MSKKTPDYPSAEHLSSMKELLTKRMAKKRKAATAWHYLMAAFGNADFDVVHDFALDQGFTVGIELPNKKRRDGQRPISMTWANPKDGSEMVWIPGGEFIYGKTKKRAVLPGYSLARHPVTNAQFATFLDETNYEPDEDHPYPEMFLHHWSNGQPSGGEEQHPVRFVSIHDALAYCRWAGLTLPTEWMWEKAARGVDGRKFPWGDRQFYTTTDKAHVVKYATCAVGSYPNSRTPYGCEDLVGNVSEWCLTTPNDDPNHLPDGYPELSFDEEERTIVRGSCFLRRDCRRMVAAHRRFLSVIRRNQWVGFRPACSLTCRPNIA